MISTSPEFINHVYTIMVRPVRCRGHLGGRISPNGALVHPRAPARSVTSLHLGETCRNHSPASIISHGALQYTHGEGSEHSTAAPGFRQTCIGPRPWSSDLMKSQGAAYNIASRGTERIQYSSRRPWLCPCETMTHHDETHDNY